MQVRKVSVYVIYGQSLSGSKQGTAVVHGRAPRCEHGTLQLKGDRIGCQCEENWWGKACDLPLCYNCGSVGRNGTCECVGDWDGPHCYCDGKRCGRFQGHRLNWEGEKCVCRSNWEGNKCDLPKCVRGTRATNQTSNLTYCNCISVLWFGDFCKKSICGKWGQPVFKEVFNVDRNLTENGVGCTCQKGWKGILCQERDCHGHGKPNREPWLFCRCDWGYNPKFDCSVCKVGWTGQNCTERRRSKPENKRKSYNPASDNIHQKTKTNNSSLVMTVMAPIIGFLAVILFLGCLKCCMSMGCSDDSSVEDGVLSEPIPLVPTVYNQSNHRLSVSTTLTNHGGMTTFTEPTAPWSYPRAYVYPSNETDRPEYAQTPPPKYSDLYGPNGKRLPSW